MSDSHNDCNRFEQWLLESDAKSDATPWMAHVESCSGCREQWAAHQMLVATFAEESVPDLSPAFQAGLDRKLELASAVAPLKGWRLAAMIAYALAAVLLLRSILTRFPLPTVSIDTSSPWTLIAALVAVPLSLWLTALATRLLPPPRAKGLRPFAL